MSVRQRKPTSSPQPLLLFFPPLLAATEPCSPPASPPLACRTPSSTLDPAPANRLRMGCSQWGAGGGGADGGPCRRSSDFYLCRHNKRDRREEEKNAQHCSCQCICSVSSSVSPLSSSPEQFMGSSCSLSLPHCLSPLREKVRMHRGGKCPWIIAAGQ